MTIPRGTKRILQQSGIPAHTHVVQFSEHETALIDAVSSFIVTGLRAGDVCLVFTTPSHRASLEQRLLAEGINFPTTQMENSLVFLDAREMITRFFVNEQLEPARFFAEMGQLIEQVGQSQRPLRIFGEMVALLWADGKQDVALHLEELWNELSQRYAFSLFCAYPLHDFDGHAHEELFIRICQQHSQVIPSESYLQLSEQERIQAFILLQQKAHALEAEIAQRRVAQERLRVLAAIVESTDDAVLSKDLDGTITSWNKAAERIYGYTAQEMIGQHVTRLFPADQPEEFEQIMSRIRRGESVEHHETRRVRKDGRVLTVSVTISPVRNEMGIVIGASTIARDITDQRLLEAKSQRLFDSNLVGIFVANADGTLLEANQAFLDLLGYTREEWQIGNTQSDISLVSSFQSLIFQACQSNSNVEPQETVIQRKSGEDLPVVVAVACIEHTQTCVGFVLDIRERKALEQRKDAFIGMASHELKTPVTSLKGFLGLSRRLLTAENGNERVLHYLTRMDAQIDKLTKLINDLLDISRMQTGQLVYREERVEMDGLVQEIVESVQETTQTHEINIEGRTSAAVFGDRDRLGQVLINLLNNAIKYSPQADKVIVRLSQEQQQVRMSVQDFGLGIAEEHHHKIFERFYQITDSDEKTYPGLGIGLAISLEIMKRHGGQLWVESQRGEGATFHLSLPYLSQEEEAALQQIELERDGQHAE